VTQDSPTIRSRPLPYESALQARPADRIDLVVIHCTELPDLAMARKYGEQVHYPATRTGNSGHFYIDRNGEIEQWVDPLRTAHHVRGFNERSIGIELVNQGRYPHWLHSGHQEMQEPYGDAQMESLQVLLAWLHRSLPALRWLAGHEDLDQELVPAENEPGSRVRRKLDPGPLFPWPRAESASPLARFRPGKAESLQ